MQDRLENGLVVRVTGGEIRVRVGRDVVACVLRGRHRGSRDALQIVAGDHVAIQRGAASGGKAATATLETVEPRRSWLSRYVERDSESRTVVANVECLFVVTALADPPLRPAFLDRVLAAAAWGHVVACVVLNKIDLGSPAEVERLRTLYVACGYDVVPTCAITGRGVDVLEARIGEGVYAFAGESGSGKTSLLNRLDPSLDLNVQAIGERTGRGRHTTTNSQLFPFRGGHLADTPGMQTFGFPGNDPDELAGCFPEFAAVESPCRFNPCTHSHEPGCAVKAAVASGAIPPSRHESYLGILAEIQQRARDKPW